MSRQRITGIIAEGGAIVNNTGELELTVCYMHGDADFSSNETSIFKGSGLQLEHLYHVADVLDHLGQYDLYTKSDYERALSQYGAPYDTPGEVCRFMDV